MLQDCHAITEILLKVLKVAFNAMKERKLQGLIDWRLLNVQRQTFHT